MRFSPPVWGLALSLMNRIRKALRVSTVEEGVNRGFDMGVSCCTDRRCPTHLGRLSTGWVLPRVSGSLWVDGA